MGAKVRVLFRNLDEIANERVGLPRLLNRARALILKHLLEAEKSTFCEEPSFQRSESTTGFRHALVFVC